VLRNPLQRRSSPVHKRWLQQQILRRIPSNRQLTEHHHSRARTHGLVVRGNDHRGVPIQIAETQIELGQPHAH